MNEQAHFNNLLSDAYQASLDPQCWQPFLTRLCDALGGDGAVVGGYDFTTRNGPLYGAIGLTAEPALTGRPQNQLGAHGAQIPPMGLATTPVGLRPTGEARLHPSGQFHRLYGILTRNGTSITFVEIVRSRRDPDYGQGERELFAMLLPHLRRAVELFRQRARLEAERDTVLHVLGHLPVGAIFVDADARVMASNRAAQRLLDHGDGLRLSQGQLAATAPRDTEKLHDLIQRAASSADTEGFLEVARARGHKPLSVMVLPLTGTGVLPEINVNAVLLLGDPEEIGHDTAEIMARLHGLTPAETRVAALIVQGYRLEQVVERLGISVNTARTHLKRIFSKTGADGQADLIRQFLNGAVHFYFR